MSVKIVDAAAGIQIDTTDTNNLYVGVSQVGTTTSTATWQIKKIVISGANISILWADGNQKFDNVWDDRASLSYS